MDYTTFNCSCGHDISGIINHQLKNGWIFDQVINNIGQSGCNNSFLILMHRPKNS